MFSKIAVLLIRAYQLSLRELLPVSCRFTPSCSEYAQQAFIKYGLLKGTQKAVARILRCHPFSGKSGEDLLE